MENFFVLNKAKCYIIAMNGEKSLERPGYKDLSRPFTMLRDLFEFAEKKGLDATSFIDYDDTGVHGRNQASDNPRAVELPERFAALTADRPGQYYIVAYENRQGRQYKEGTRSRTIRLSSVRKKNKSDERVREIDWVEVDPSLGSKAQMTIRESVNNKSFVDLSTTQEDEVDQPHGEATIRYELDPNGNKSVVESKFNRLDEGIFLFREENRPVRWVRNLKVDKDSSGAVQAVYEDAYYIGRPKESKRDEAAKIKTFVAGSIDNPTSIKVEIGLEGLGKTRTLFKDKQLSVIVHEGINAYQNHLEIAKLDPAYAALFAEPIDVEELIKNVKFKIGMLTEDWDKPQAVFSSKPNLEAGRKELGS